MHLEERRCRSKLVKMIKDVDNKFDDYSILRIQKDFFIHLTN